MAGVTTIRNPIALARRALGIAAMIATGYLGTITGARILSVVPERVFRRVFKLLLTLLALDLIRRALL